MSKRSIILALLSLLVATPVYAKTFVGVLWPMFGPLPAIGLVELVSELKEMPNVEVKTYLHEQWPQLVEDLRHLPPGTRTFLVGYSLGANATVNVANKTPYIDEIIALQPSQLSWIPAMTGHVGRYIEVYNPNPWETFGGMGSRKIEGPNIEYIANHDSHPGAQFDPDFRNLVKTQLAALSRGDDVTVARADAPAAAPVERVAMATAADGAGPGNEDKAETKDGADSEHPQLPLGYAAAPGGRDADPIAALMQRSAASRSEVAAVNAAASRNSGLVTGSVPTPAAMPAPRPQRALETAFLDQMSSAVNSGQIDFGSDFGTGPRPRLTAAALKAYGARMYRARLASLASAE